MMSVMIQPAARFVEAQRVCRLAAVCRVRRSVIVSRRDNRTDAARPVDAESPRRRCPPAASRTWLKLVAKTTSLGPA
jgi:hypothetical protein